MTEDTLARIVGAELDKRHVLTEDGFLPAVAKRMQQAGKRWWGKTAVYVGIATAGVGFYNEFRHFVFFLADRLPR